jgi:hypothetical protein
MPGLRCGKPSELRLGLRLLGAVIVLRACETSAFYFCALLEVNLAMQLGSICWIGEASFQQLSVSSRFLSSSFQCLPEYVTVLTETTH